VQDEPLNAECDIEAISFHLEQPEEVFYNATDTVPDFRFFYQVNYPGSYTKAVKEPLDMVIRRRVRFVVTNDFYDLSNCGYRLKDARSCYYTDINGNVAQDVYYLYELDLFA
jgi:hypothetical protein